MSVFTDQTGATIQLLNTPQRIISIVPSQTEVLFYLGLDSQVAGITKFCVHPTEWLRTKKKVGGTKNLNLETIRQLQPDLILANKEENTKEQIEILQKEYPVWISDISNLEEAYQMIEQVGFMTDQLKKATALIKSIRYEFSTLTPPPVPSSAAYLIWQRPYMTVGGDTFIHAMLEIAGFKNVFADKKRYPEVTIEELRLAKPEWLLLSSEPFPFKQKHINELQKQLPNTKIILADGQIFSWYGSRLLLAPGYFKKLRE